MSRFKYSLVVATYGRKQELECLLISLTRQTIQRSEFEVIIVDQNESDLLTDLVNNYSSRLNIIHLRSSRKGLSYNRNLGIDQASGIYIAVPDDDCEYYEDSLQRAGEELEKLQYPDMLIGRVFNRTQQKHVFKRTPDQVCEISQSNFYALVSSISLFFKKGEGRFDEEFGIGAHYHSNEDGELILDFLSRKKKVFYTPVVEFDHPPYDAGNMSLEKLYKYGIGFGALCRKYASAPVLFLYAKVIVFQVLMLLKGVLLFNFKEAARRWQALKGRLKGFILYPGH